MWNIFSKSSIPHGVPRGVGVQLPWWLILGVCMAGTGVELAHANSNSVAGQGTGTHAVSLLGEAAANATQVVAGTRSLTTSLTLPAQLVQLRSRPSNYGSYGASGSHVDVDTGTTYNYQVQDQGWFYYNWQVEVPASEAEPAPGQELRQATAQYQTPPSQSYQVQSSPVPEPTSTARSQSARQVYLDLGNPATREVNTVPAVPRNITSAWLRVNLPLYLEHAVDQPTDNNVLAFLYLQAFANQKAWVFSERAKLVAQGNDYLDNNGAFPNLYTARAYREQLAKHIRATLFNKFQDQVGLILLISSDYESRAFAQLVGLFSLKYNIKFVTANLHGKFQPDLANYNQITNLREVAQLVRKQQAQIYPTLYVVDRQQTSTLVTGAIDSDELEQRMLRYLFKQNYITQTEYNMARGILIDPQQSDVQLASLINGKLLQGQVRVSPNWSGTSQMSGASPMLGIHNLRTTRGVVSNPYATNLDQVMMYQGMPMQGIPPQATLRQGLPNPYLPYQDLPYQELPHQGLPNLGVSNSSLPYGMNAVTPSYHPYGASSEATNVAQVNARVMHDGSSYLHGYPNRSREYFGMQGTATPSAVGGNGNLVPAADPASIISSYLQGGMYVP